MKRLEEEQTLFEDLRLPFGIPASVSPRQQTQLARVSIKAIIGAGGLDHIRYGHDEPAPNLGAR